MPYSQLLMTSIFIKGVCSRGGAGGGLCVPPASRLLRRGGRYAD
jgi:hypothetical protein